MSFDSEEANRAFAEKFDFPFELLCDVDRSVALAYGACGSREAEWPARVTFLIGADGRVLRTWDQVAPRGHADEVLAALDET